MRAVGKDLGHAAVAGEGAADAEGDAGAVALLGGGGLGQRARPVQPHLDGGGGGKAAADQEDADGNGEADVAGGTAKETQSGRGERSADHDNPAR